jgi:hypothetical protein
VAPRDEDGVPKGRLACRDDDPACDFGAVTGDEGCTFRVALCVNVAERRFVARRTGEPLCAPTDVAWIAMRIPSEAAPRDAADAANRDALEAALSELGANVRRQCQPPGTEPSTACAVDGDCARPRRCRTRFMSFSPALATRDRCTPPASIVVPLRRGASGLAAGRRTLRLIAATSAPRAPHDGDVLQLVCLPSP